MVQELQITPIPVRVKFYKTGMLQYISHLDLVRTMTRILVRSEIPAVYSQGFNPRLKLIFAMPLSIGTQSEIEFFDIKLTSPMDFSEIKRRLNSALADEMQVTEVYQSERKFSGIAWAEYEIKMTSPVFDKNTASDLSSLYTNPLVITKRSKTGDKQADIRPFISLKSCGYAEGTVTVNALLSADSANYLNPEYLVRAAEELTGVKFDDPFSEFYTIIRKEVFEENKTTIFR